MLAFKVHQLQLGRWNYLLLPKLNSGQMRVLARRLSKMGFTVQNTHGLLAKSKEGTIRINPSGLCWSAFDPADILLPAIPEMLACPKERIKLDELKAAYFKVARVGRSTILRLNPRMESSWLWDALRASGECGLAPDEREVASSLIKERGGNCMTTTDFPVEGSVLRLHGRKRYYQSILRSSEAASTLRAVGEKAPRNSYLQRDGTLTLSGKVSPSPDELAKLFSGLGEWCFFNPV